MLTKLLSLAKSALAVHTAGMEEPQHVLAAPSHPDPYGWYARLRVRCPIFFDNALGLWVVSGPYLVEQALLHPQLRVRPPTEPVPRALQGRRVGEVFAQLVRMNDGEFHATQRPAVDAAAARWSDGAVVEATQAATRDLAPRRAPNALLSEIPVQAMARLLGVTDLDRTVAWVHDFVQGIGAGASAEAVERADAAAHALIEQVGTPARIAFMQQALDATAGLIGNAIHALLKDPQAHDVMVQVVRDDAAVHNTRRFAAADLALGGERIAQGQALVLVLVPGLTFGRGAHACPGERIALQIAATAVRSLQAIAPLERTFGGVRGYRPLTNARVPVFTP